MPLFGVVARTTIGPAAASTDLSDEDEHGTAFPDPTLALTGGPNDKLMATPKWWLDSADDPARYCRESRRDT
jgi:hypothetical protein